MSSGERRLIAPELCRTADGRLRVYMCFFGDCSHSFDQRRRTGAQPGWAQRTLAGASASRVLLVLQEEASRGLRRVRARGSVLTETGCDEALRTAT